MRDMTDPGNLNSADVGGSAGNQESNDGTGKGVGRWFGFGLSLWLMVIVIGLIFVGTIFYFAR